MARKTPVVLDGGENYQYQIRLAHGDIKSLRDQAQATRDTIVQSIGDRRLRDLLMSHVRSTENIDIKAIQVVHEQHGGAYPPQLSRFDTRLAARAEAFSYELGLLLDHTFAVIVARKAVAEVVRPNLLASEPDKMKVILPVYERLLEVITLISAEHGYEQGPPSISRSPGQRARAVRVAIRVNRESMAKTNLVGELHNLLTSLIKLNFRIISDETRKEASKSDLEKQIDRFRRKSRDDLKLPSEIAQGKLDEAHKYLVDVVDILSAAPHISLLEQLEALAKPR